MTSPAQPSDGTTIETRLVVGFEIHVQLATQTKLFCGCAVRFGAEPNTLLCPVCTGLPGALPVMNRKAFELAVLTGLALGCEIPPITKWDRKSYFYPDLPKNYQISQYDKPLSRDGTFEIVAEGQTHRIGIIRAHLEEDAGKNLHDQPGCTLVDLNRAGTPLLEIVTHPDIHSAEQAYVFCTELHKLVTHLHVSAANMQMGQMRFEPNINVAIRTSHGEFFTPIVEVKNLNSFRSVRDAIDYEFRRQVQDWLADPSYVKGNRPNENRGWDDERGATVFQRGKEAAHDYRYFPDPDLARVCVQDQWLQELRDTLPELPLARRLRLQNEYCLSEADAAQIVSQRETADLFEDAVAEGVSAATVAKQFVNIWARLANEREVSIGRLGIDARRLAGLSRLVDDGTVSATSANKIAPIMLESPDPPHVIAERLGLVVVQDHSQLQAWVDQVWAENEDAVQDAIQSPKKAKAAAGFLRGQVMKLSGGKADPKRAGEMIQAKLDQSSPTQ